MKLINLNKKYLFLLCIFLIFFSFYSYKEGYYGYDQQWDVESDQWAPCDINFSSIPILNYKNKCCSNDSKWDPSISLCHPECPMGKLWDKYNSKCVDAGKRCPDGYSIYKGNGKCGNIGFNNDVNSNF